MVGVTVLVIGVDPGTTTGICALKFDAGQRLEAPVVFQAIGYESVLIAVNAVLDQVVADDCLLAIEAFVVGNRAARSGHPGAGEHTRRLIGALGTLGVQTFSRNAATVKAWATDVRLAKSGLLEPTKGMGHARDAARHALFAAVHQNITVDPLSSKAELR